jgi:hypothetical protein
LFRKALTPVRSIFRCWSTRPIFNETLYHCQRATKQREISYKNTEKLFPDKRFSRPEAFCLGQKNVQKMLDKKYEFNAPKFFDFSKDDVDEQADAWFGTKNEVSNDVRFETSFTARFH